VRDSVDEHLDLLTQEAREHMGAPEAARVDWAAVDAALFSRIRTDTPARSSERRPAWWKPAALAGGLAMAATTAVVLAGSARGPGLPFVPASPRIAGSSESILIERADGVTVGGSTAAAGAHVGLGDVVETQVDPMTLRRDGRVLMTLEPQSRVRVSALEESLVLILERGAVEARVTPVPSGEAFAVDVDGSRVAVHGTHLRVERVADRVVVDLDEGVVAIGKAPRSGVVAGTVVSAPAHMDFSSADPSGTLRLSRDPASVHWAAAAAKVAPDSYINAAGPAGAAEDEPTAPRVEGERPPPRPESEPVSPRATGRLAAEPRLYPRPAAAPAAAPATPSPEAEIASAVQRCMTARPRADNLTIVVRTTLHLTVDSDGSVQSARFEPPVAPDVNACATASIYHTHFEHGGVVSVPVDFELKGD
jgi:hypothetical protein